MIVWDLMTNLKYRVWHEWYVHLGTGANEEYSLTLIVLSCSYGDANGCHLSYVYRAKWY